MSGVGDARERQRLLDGAIAELVSMTDIGDFLLEDVAARAGVNIVSARRFWANTPALFTAALQEWGARNIPVPDTGSLRGDLLEYSKSFATATNTPAGRKLLDAVVISQRDWDTYGSREAFRSVRPARTAVMFRRAIDRGECASDVDPGLATEVLGAALCMLPLFYDRQISDEHCADVVELLLNGVLRR